MREGECEFYLCSRTLRGLSRPLGRQRSSITLRTPQEELNMRIPGAFILRSSTLALVMPMVIGGLLLVPIDNSDSHGLIGASPLSAQQLVDEEEDTCGQDECEEQRAANLNSCLDSTSWWNLVAKAGCVLTSELHGIFCGGMPPCPVGYWP